MSFVYDAGDLIAAERNDRAVWADHAARLQLGLVPVTTAPVVAQVSRCGRQAQLQRLLRGCEVAAFSSTRRTASAPCSPPPGRPTSSTPTSCWWPASTEQS